MLPSGADARRRAWCAALQGRWHDEIPITASMGISIDTFDGNTLAVRAALAQNVNVHGSVFAGSLFSLASLCGWGLIYLQLLQHDGSGSIVFVDGRLRCLKPARADIVATATWSGSAEAALKELLSQGHCRINLSARVDSGAGTASEFSGEYAVRRERIPEPVPPEPGQPAPRSGQ
jgi:thioesterase domain-containing protein